MRLIVPIPLPRDDLKALEQLLASQYHTSLEELMRNAIDSWEAMADLDAPSDGVFLATVSAEDFAQWYELSHQLTQLVHRMGQQIYQQLEPAMRSTFGSAEVAVRFLRYLPGALMLDLNAPTPTEDDNAQNP